METYNDISFLQSCWQILGELAPWLLLGMLLSGLLHVFLPANFIRRKLSGTAGIFKAVILGIPLPLCSCGVIPAGIGLRNQGASNGAAVGFLISTPQTGVDSILVSAAFLGWPFAIFKMITAIITGITGGWLVDRMDEREEIEKALASSKSATPISNAPREETKGSAVHSNLSLGSLPVIQPVTPTAPVKRTGVWGKAKDAWGHGFMIYRSIWIWLVVGIALSAALQVWIPQPWLQQVGEAGLIPAMLLVLLISIPIYVCATASVPLAATLVLGGFPAGAALVFLVAGPATNITTIGSIYQRFGTKIAATYLSTIMVGSILFGILFQWLLQIDVIEEHVHCHSLGRWWETTSALLLFGMTTYLIVEKVGKRFGWN